MTRFIIVLLWVALSLGGCGTSSPAPDNWAYIGNDRTLQSPPMPARGNLPADVYDKQFNESFSKWQLLRRDAADASKAVCAQQTGDSKTPDYWRGYSAAFMSCMKAQGWTRAGNPL